MKEYVLDLGPRSPTAAMPVAAGSPEAPYAGLRRARWRAIGLVLLIEPIALAALYFALVGGPETGRASSSEGVAAAAPPRRVERAPTVPAEPAVVAAPSTKAPIASQGRVTTDRGRYVIDLQAVAPDAAVAMLARATRAKVTGEHIFDGSALRLTHASLEPSPREAWQAVFGDVANFAVACAGGACEVRFVSLVRPATSGQSPASAGMVEALVQGGSMPTPMPAPTEQGRAPPRPAPPPTAQTDDPNASDN